MKQALQKRAQEKARLKRLRSATGVAYPTGYYFFRGAIYRFSKLFISTRIYKDENLPQPKGVKYRPPYYRRNGTGKIGTGQGYIIAANHGKIWDIPFIGIFRRGLVWVCKPQFCRNKLLAFVNQRMGAVPVFRPSIDGVANKSNPEKIAHLKSISYQPSELTEVAVQALSRGVPVLMFPEGSRVGSSVVGESKLGAARIARISDCPIVPVAIIGCSKGDPDVRTSILRRKIILGLVGKPIIPSTYSKLGNATEVETAMMEDWRLAINELRDYGRTQIIGFGKASSKH